MVGKFPEKLKDTISNRPMNLKQDMWNETHILAPTRYILPDTQTVQNNEQAAWEESYFTFKETGRKVADGVSGATKRPENGGTAWEFWKVVRRT